MTPRPARPGDEPGLRRLWTEVFGDGPDFLDPFFARLFPLGGAALMEEHGRILSAAYALETENIRYIYAVATAPEARGRGFGKAVTLAAAGGRPACLCPASEGLRDWYARELGAVSFLLAPRQHCGALLAELSPAEYKKARESLLSELPHARYPLPWLEFFHLDGRFYRCSDGIAAIDGSGRVREALPGVESRPHVMGLNGAEPLYFPLVLD